MEYFDTLTQGVEDALKQRGINTENLLYCMKCDMDGNGLYYDTYLVFDSEKLYIVGGYDRQVRKRKEYITEFDFERYEDFTLGELSELYVDRYSHTCRLMGRFREDSGEKEVCISRFSSGFSEKAEQFCRRFNMTVKGEEADDSALAEKNPFCPRCHRRYPDPNRKYCPFCVKRTSLFKRLMGMFGDFKLQTAMIIVMMALSAALSIISPYFGTAFLYDEVLDAAGDFYGQILFAVIVMAAFKLMSELFRTAYGVVFSFATSKVMHKIRIKVFAAMENLSLSFFTSKQTGSLMTRVDRDAGDVYNFFTNIVPQFINNIVKIFAMMLLMFMFSPILAVMIAAMMVLVFFSELFFAKGQRPLWRGVNLAVRRMQSNLNDSVNGHRVIKAFAREKQEKKRFGKSLDNVYDANITCDMRFVRFDSAQRAIYTIGKATLTAIGFYLVINGSIGLGELMLMISYFGMLMDPMFFFVWAGNEWSRCTDAASRIFEIIDSSPTVKPPAAPAPVGSGGLKGDITMKNVSFEYEAGVPVIKDISIDIKAGQFYGIVGRTGAGKSTLINLISRLYDPTNGEIRIDGVPIREIAFADLRRSIGIVSQETYLFMGSVADNIRYSRPDATIEEVVEAAKSANAHDFILKLPDGYDTRIGSGGVSLSGGERQRISIARALIQKPNILILDEATASMDTKTERKIQNAIDNLKKGRTVIAIAHRLSTLRDADMLCVIEHGEVKETGTHDELIRSKGKYFELYKLQAEALKTIGVE